MNLTLTVSTILVQLLVDLLHPLDVDPGDLVVVHYRSRVVLADDALGCFLHRVWRVPRFMDVPRGEVFQNRQIPSGVRGEYKERTRNAIE